MDQVKVVLALMKKHGFWILIALVVLIGVGVWFTAAGALAARYETRKGELETQYTTVNGIKSESTGENATHPNEQKIEQWKGLVQKNRLEALAAWKLMHRDQKERNKWPEILSDDFKRMIVRIGPDGTIPDRFLEEYQNFIKDNFPYIDKIIDRRKPKAVEGRRPGVAGMPGSYGGAEETMYGGGSMAPGGYGMDGSGYGMEGSGSGMEGSGYGMEGSGYGMSGMPSSMLRGANMEGIVEWNDSDYARIQNSVYWEKRPFTIQVRIAQEDFWVYQALLRSIALTNEQVGATNYFNAAIKRIEALEIGQPAARAMQSAKNRIGLGGPMGGGEYSGESYGEEMYSEDMGSSGMMGGSGMMGSSGMMSGGMGEDMYGESGSGYGAAGMGAPTEEQWTTKLLSYRYVDLKGEPQAADAEPYAEFKLMPVHIAIEMDQHKLPDFLVNLANCEMPVDVKQVSIHADGKMSLASAGGSGGAYGEGMMGSYGSGGGEMMGGYDGGSGSEMMGGYEGEDMYGSGSGGSMGMAGAGVNTATDEAKQDIPIEIFGVIRIFNPPDLEKLGTGTEATGETGDATPPAAPTTGPAPGPAPAGPTPGPTSATPTPAPGPAGSTPGPAAPGPGPAGPTPGPATGAPAPGSGSGGATPGPAPTGPTPPAAATPPPPASG